MEKQLIAALDLINIKIFEYNISKKRPISLGGGPMSVEGFCKLFRERLGEKISKFPDLVSALFNPEKMEKLLIDLAREQGNLKGEKVEIEIPEDMENLTLNIDLTAKGKMDTFFMTTADDIVSPISADSYLLITQMPPKEAAAVARKVIPRYEPRKNKRIFEVENNKVRSTIFNLYTPPEWTKHEYNQYAAIPPLFFRLVKHLIPDKLEREYFYDWLHESLYSRSFVYLVLCGPPGIGKNVLKKVVRALHGHVNTVDGKKSTLVEKFNSQLGEATLAWFDELKYDAEMENVMKELQNDTISIERKGVDASRSTRIHSSIIISNNKPRDNYLDFEARKFAPLVLSGSRLETSMSAEEIDTLVKKVEKPDSKKFDTKFLADIAHWLKARGTTGKWKNLEYKGPMFWKLTHTSMTRWQKRIVSTIMEPETKSQKYGYDLEKKSFLWSTMHLRLIKKSGDKSMTFPDYSSVSAFFDAFRDGEGKKAFSIKLIEGDILGDFWVKPLFKNIKVLTEGQVIGEGAGGNEKEKRKPTNKLYEDL